MSPIAAGKEDDEAVAPRGDRLCRLFAPTALAAMLGLTACSTPAPVAVAAPPAAAESPAPPEPAQAAPATVRIPELPMLTGMGPTELVALFGEPDFRRREPPAELWQYRSADCVLDVFLYGEAGRYRVVRSETRDRHVLPPLIASCTAAAFDGRARQSRL